MKILLQLGKYTNLSLYKARPFAKVNQFLMYIKIISYRIAHKSLGNLVMDKPCTLVSTVSSFTYGNMPKPFTHVHTHILYYIFECVGTSALFLSNHISETMQKKRGSP